MTEPLPLAAVIGFAGSVPNGLIAHPDGETIVYPLGSTIVLRSKSSSEKQEFLRGHSHEVSCLALSPSGRYLASGQKTYMGFTADIILWDLATKKVHKKLVLHKVMVQALDFSPDESKLVSIGGPDDASLVLWDVETGQAICGSPTNGKFLQAVRWLNTSNTKLATVGQGSAHLWEYDAAINKVRASAFELGKLGRTFNAVTIASDDSYLYAASASGDIMEVNLQRSILKRTGPKKALPGGITAAAVVPGAGCVLVGTGAGTLGLVSTAEQGANGRAAEHMVLLATAAVDGRVTSLSLDPSSPSGAPVATATAATPVIAYVGTDAGNMYQALVDTRGKSITPQLVQSAHAGAISSVAFPDRYGEVFATAAFGEVRVWHITTCRELLRVRVPNLACRCLAFSHDGGAILSGWDDGTVRAFGPQSGKALWSVAAHHRPVTALAGCLDGARIITGGEDGMVRVWQVGAGGAKMLTSMKDHRGAVNSIMVSPKTGAEAISASSDGTCILWDLDTLKRRASFMSNTFFKAVAYHPDESQAITTGTDRKLAYWDVYDGSAVRVVDASESAACCDVAVDADGEVIVSGGADKLVQVWGYDQGFCYFTGVGHSGAVNRVRVSPDKARIVSVGAEGGIFIWRYAAPPVGELANAAAAAAGGATVEEGG